MSDISRIPIVALAGLGYASRAAFEAERFDTWCRALFSDPEECDAFKEAVVELYRGSFATLDEARAHVLSTWRLR